MDNLEKEREYRSRTFNFGGYALMTPLGHIVINPTAVLGKLNLIWAVMYFIFCFALFLGGLCLIEIGRDILYRRR